MNQVCGLMIVATASAIFLASASCSLQPPGEPSYAFCHANSDCDSPRVCNQEIGYWRPPDTPADSGVCIEAKTASCPAGYVMTGGYNPHRGWNTSFCVAGPTYCHTDQECAPPDKCDKHTETYIPQDAGPDAGVCLVGN